MAWIQYLDDTNWVPDQFTGSWNGSAWVSSGFDDIHLLELGTWVEGFRPAGMRLTLSGQATYNVTLTDKDNQPRVSNSSYVSGGEETIGWGSSDINKLVVWAFGSFTITNIEFGDDSVITHEGEAIASLGLSELIGYDHIINFVGEILNLESFTNTTIALVSETISVIDLSSRINYNVALESYFYDILALESSIYLEEV